MAIQHKQTSIAKRPKTPEELTAENKALGEKVAALEAVKTSLEAQVTDLQLALCDVYEMAALGGGNGGE